MGKISFSNVSFAFDQKQIISQFSQVIEPGEHVCLMGESGAGKSTLLNSVVGLTMPQSGKILIDNIEVNAQHIHKIRSKVAWLPQDLNLPYETVREALEAPYLLAVNKHMKFDQELCLRLFGRIGLDHTLLDKNMKTISGGEKQRMLLTSAIMLQRKVILLDEPTSALDGENRNRVIDLLKSLSDTTILTVTHDEQLAQSFDRVITLKKQ